MLEERVKGEPSLGERGLARVQDLALVGGRRLVWRKFILGERKIEEKQCEAQVFSVVAVRCEGRRLGDLFVEERWRWF